MRGYGKLPTDPLNRDMQLSVSVYAHQTTLSIIDALGEIELVTITLAPDDCLELAEALKSAWIDMND